MEPTNQDWLELYEAAGEFKKLKPWEWLSNVHLFGVRSPRDHLTGYCCVMGSGKEVFGLAVYLGTEGLQTVLDLLNGEFTGDPLFAQHCYMLSFGSRDELYPEEYERVKELDLSLNGKNAWPSFRLYEPGYVPWPLSDREDVAFFTDIIKQAMEVSRSHRQDPDVLLEGNGERFLVRIPVAGKDDGTTEWISEWREPDPADRPLVPSGRAVVVDELRMAKARRAVNGDAGVWEVDSFFIPMPIEEERPFYPTMNVIADQETGQVLHYGLTKRNEASENLAEGLLSLIETHRVIPIRLVVRHSLLLDELALVIAGFGLVGRVEPQLPAIEEFQQSVGGTLL
ncbi:MAG: hypothetical protein E7E23_22015 [Paenibacillus sp.]|uniref:DUF7309 domain-containing protein n=1 Tax=Paenibacillus sp. TaxID=58172 RepID=UPI002902DBF6|nr:hypothetical protein [Paenibacillus sp.]MDU2243247.1 hypothetical protein [Paenibacillus sp.]